VVMAQGREWTEEGVEALETVTEAFLRLWREQQQRLDEEKAAKDEAFRSTRNEAYQRFCYALFGPQLHPPAGE
jgi:hypothetical protein